MAAQARRPCTACSWSDLAKGGAQFPCHASAQDAEMCRSSDYQDFVFRGGMLHQEDPAAAWRKLSEQQQRMVDLLNTVRELWLLCRKAPMDPSWLKD